MPNRRAPKQHKELTANQMIYQELQPYKDIVGFGTFSKVLRTKDPDETLSLLLTSQGEGGYSFLMELPEYYLEFLTGADETDPKLISQNAEIVYKMIDAFEGFLNALYYKGLL